MTSIPASRRARAMIFAPRSWPSRPGLRSPLGSSPAHGQNTAVRLTVIGSSPAWPNPGSAHSGYMLQADGSRVLLDCGPGVLGRLREHGVAGCRRDRDHALPPRSLGRPRAVGMGQLLPRVEPPSRSRRSGCSPAAAAFLVGLGRGLGFPDMFERTFHLSEYAPDTPFSIGKLSVTATGCRTTPSRRMRSACSRTAQCSRTRATPHRPRSL